MSCGKESECLPIKGEIAIELYPEGYKSWGCGSKLPKSLNNEVYGETSFYGKDEDEESYSYSDDETWFNEERALSEERTLYEDEIDYELS